MTSENNSLPQKFGRGGFLKIYLGVVGSSKVQAFVREHDLGWLMTPTNSRDPKEIQVLPRQRGLR